MKYAILVIETGEYLYSFSGMSNTLLRSKQESQHPGCKVAKFFFKKEAEDKLKTVGECIVFNNETLQTNKNLYMFEIIEINDETI